jgi:hypothetical protein
MADGDPRTADGAERLDLLIRSFASADYMTDGLGVEGADRLEHDHGGHDSPSGHGGHDGASVRVFDHRGHRVQIATSYEITVDGERWDQHIEVLDDGNVVYHGLPQYLVPSAVDMVRAVIDSSYEAPEEIRAGVRAAQAEA